MSQPHLAPPNGQTPVVLTSPNLVIVFSGQFWAERPDFVETGTQFFAEYLAGYNFERLTQYGVGLGQIRSIATITTPMSPTDPDAIADWLAQAIKAGQLPQTNAYANQVYVVVLDPTLPGFMGDAAQHWMSINTGKYQGGIEFLFLYSLIPQTLAASAVAPGMTGPAWWASAAEFTRLLSHEMYETFTDPYNFTGWIDINFPSGQTSECCDICDDLGMTYQQVNRWTMNNYWSNQDNACSSGYANGWTALGKPTAAIYGTPAVAQYQNGVWQMFAVSNTGDLWQNSQNPSGTWTAGGWHKLMAGVDISGPPVPMMNTSLGLLEIFAISNTTANGVLWHTYQTSPNGPWSPGQLLGGPGSAIMGNVVVGRNAPNASGYPALEAFVIGGDKQLHHIWQLGANRGWSGWGNSLGAPSVGIAPPVINGADIAQYYAGAVVASNADGRLEVFLLGNDLNIWHIWQTAPNGTWSAWQTLGSPTTAGGSPILNYRGRWQIGKNSDGRVELFVAGTDGNVYHIWQIAPNGVWSGWGPLPLINAGSAVQFNGYLTVVDNVNGYGGLEVFTVGSDNGLWTSAQALPGQGWKPWRYLGSPATTELNPGQFIALAVSTQGAMTAVVVGNDGSVYAVSQASVDGPWGQLLIT